MTRGQIKERVRKRLDRSDNEFNELVDGWINEVVGEIERLHPFYYMGSDSTQTLSSGTAEYTLPSTLIPHHDFSVRLKFDDGTFRELVRVSWDEYHRSFSNPEEEGDPFYYILLETDTIRFHPIPQDGKDIVYYGFFYTDTSSWTDSSTNWLTINKPHVVIEGVSAISFEHFYEPDKADRARAIYNAYINGNPKEGIIGIIQEAKKQDLKNTHPRVRMIYDEPKGRKKRFYGV